MSVCTNEHRNDTRYETLPGSQAGPGRHRCAGCAYERGYEAGRALTEKIDMDLNSLPDSQARVVRHKSPHAAYAQGYFDGVSDHYAALATTS